MTTPNKIICQFQPGCIEFATNKIKLHYPTKSTDTVYLCQGHYLIGKPYYYLFGIDVDYHGYFNHRGWYAEEPS